MSNLLFFNQSFLENIHRISTIVNVPLHLANLFKKLAINNLTDLTHLITFFILILLHTVSKIGVYRLLYILAYAL